MCMEKLNEKIKCMKWYDISMIKLSTAAFVLMVAKLWDGILALNWHWYLVIGVVAAIGPMLKLFGCCECSAPKKVKKKKR